MVFEEIPFTFTTFVTSVDMELYEHEGEDRRDIRPFVDEVIESTDRDNIDLKEFLDYILNISLTDKQMEALWQSAGPMYQFSLGLHRSVFAYARDRISEKYPERE